MAITIRIKEKDNRLDFEHYYSPIVCGNTNYRIKFNFSDAWKDCFEKTAVFVVGSKKNLISFSGDSLKLPAMPNASELFLSLISGAGTDKQQMTTSLKLRMEPVASNEKMAEFSSIKNYIASLHGIMNNIKNGSIQIRESLVAKRASTPNLLINGDFKVNQRGEKVYVFENSGGYFADRWFASEGQSLELNADGSVTQTNLIGSDNLWICQWIEDFGTLLGKTITVSMCVRGVKNDQPYKIGIFDGKQENWVSATYAEDGEQTVSITMAMPAKIDGTKLGIMVCPLVSSEAKTEATICFVKLELGEVATDFVPRLYAEELALCQRFYQCVGIAGGFTIAKSKHELCQTIPLTVPMRGLGTATASKLPQVANVRVQTQAENVVLRKIFSNCAELKIYTESDKLLENDFYSISGGKVIIDAEIY